METKNAHEPQAAQVPNTAQRLVGTPRGDYLIQVSWPLGWALDKDGTPDVTDVPVIYLVDGNAYFFTATDIARRLQFTFKKKTVVVGVGYPITDGVYVPSRRGLDLSPPSKKGQSPGPGSDGKPRDPASFGGADGFQEILESVVMPLVEREILPTVPLRQMRNVFFGHSFGGLFTLHSLFTRPGVFDTYVAASPAIWWNGASIVDEQEQDFVQGRAGHGGGEAAPAPGRKPRLYLTYGTQEHEIIRKAYESDEEFEQRQKDYARYGLGVNALAMAARLDASQKLDEVWVQAFEGDDHGSAAVSSLQRALTKIHGEWAE